MEICLEDLSRPLRHGITGSLGTGLTECLESRIRERTAFEIEIRTLSRLLPRGGTLGRQQR